MLLKVVIVLNTLFLLEDSKWPMISVKIFCTLGLISFPISGQTAWQILLIAGLTSHQAAKWWQFMVIILHWSFNEIPIVITVDGDFLGLAGESKGNIL